MPKNKWVHIVSLLWYSKILWISYFFVETVVLFLPEMLLLTKKINTYLKVNAVCGVPMNLFYLFFTQKNYMMTNCHSDIVEIWKIILFTMLSSLKTWSLIFGVWIYDSRCIFQILITRSAAWPPQKIFIASEIIVCLNYKRGKQDNEREKYH